MSPRATLLPVVSSVLSALSVPAAAQDALDVQSYVATVLRHHPAARVQRGLEGQARAETKGAWLPPDPGVEYSRARARPKEAGSPRATETGFSLSQTIRWPGATAAGLRASRRAAEALDAAAQATRWEITVAARQAFGDLVASRALLAIDEAAEADARSLRDLVTRRTELGDTRESDRIKATVEWLRQRRLLESTRREAAAAENVVRLLAVERLPEPLILEGSEPVAAIPPSVREAALGRLLEHSPRLVIGRAQAARQRELVSQTKQARLPDLELTLFRERELDKAADGFAVGIRLPLWSANGGEIARARAAASVAAAEAERTQLELVAELEGRLRDLEVASVQVQTLSGEILPSAERSLWLARRSYEEGETSLLDLLDAQRTFRDTQREAAESRRGLVLAVAAIQRLVGPDFDPWR